TLNVQQIQQKGISMIHQEILLIPELSVAQNIFLGKEFKQTFWLNDKQINQKAQDLMNLMGLDINVRTKAKFLSIAQKQLVEIAKAISNHIKVIIMDEPSSALSEKESNMLFRIIEDLKKKGTAIIYISHKLDEIY